ncbi:hypothetical protein SANT12839_061220 [Streptomyces antimycoticus]|uniref:Uncharacterized protein n=1 Tax=Streptomyces antimycoticus TaxID=68175 RepID=A0A4D4KEK6_9ACTN|nr:hypothetical protein SANT12839_061220 [Streptomyces antimycoticus]
MNIGLQRSPYVDDLRHTGGDSAVSTQPIEDSHDEPLFPMPPLTEQALRVAVRSLDLSAAVRFEEEFHSAWQEAVQTDSTVPMHTFLHRWGSSSLCGATRTGLDDSTSWKRPSPRHPALRTPGGSRQRSESCWTPRAVR